MIRKTELIPQGKRNRPGNKINPLKITIHNTSNKHPQANAIAHSKFVRNTGYYILNNGKKRFVSWHFTVDDKYIIKQLPINEKAYHAGNSANNMSLAIEICMHDGINQLEANKNAAKLTAYLCKKLNLNKDDILPHKFWTGKNCPQLLLNSWTEFKDLINYYYNQLNDNKLIEFKTKILDYAENSKGFKTLNSNIKIDEIPFQFENCLHGENN